MISMAWKLFNAVRPILSRISSNKSAWVGLKIVTFCGGVTGIYYTSSLSPALAASVCSSSYVPFSSIPPNEWMTTPVTDLKVLLKDSSFKAKMESMCMEMQASFCHSLEKIDGKGKFFVDKWARKAGGGGISCVMQEGEVFEKAGVNISVISGNLSKDALKLMKAKLKDIDETKEYPFIACGISSVIHPRNPHVPTIHFNFRYFELDHGNGKTSWWYGGGTDLTPNYLIEEDVVHFHRTLKEACDKEGPNYYTEFKKICDKYFVITHRGECRGVGGLFFDDFTLDTQAKAFSFVKTCAESVIPAYLPIVERRKSDPYTYDDRQWQLLRRGRYVEFNLVYDRGTKFGLYTPEARIESILMSLPLFAKWHYCHDPSDDPKKMALMEVLKNPRDWV